MGFLNSIEGIEDGCGHVSYNLPVVPNKFRAEATTYEACSWADEDRCEGKNMGDSIHYHEGEAFTGYPSTILGDGARGVQMAVNTYNHIDASQKHITIDHPTGQRSYQQDAKDWTVAYCDEISSSNDKTRDGNLFDNVESFSYEGMATIP